MNPDSPARLLAAALDLARTFSARDEPATDAAILALFLDHDARRAACVLALALTIITPRHDTPPQT